jgi:hypothetical protein
MDETLIPESDLKFRWCVAQITIRRWRRDESKAFPLPVAQFGERRLYRLRDVLEFERRELAVAA